MPNTPSALPIPVSAALSIAKEYGYDQVVIMARKVGDAGTEHVTTAGVNDDHCRAAARTGDFLKYKIMGWPQHHEVDILREELSRVREDLEGVRAAANGVKFNLTSDSES